MSFERITAKCYEEKSEQYGIPLSLLLRFARNSSEKGVADINEMAGNSIAESWEELKHQIDAIIQPEVDETRKGVFEKDFTELRDGIGDILFTVLGLAARAGIPALHDIYDVIYSNLTKFDSNEHDAVSTRARYENIGVPVYQIGTQITGADSVHPIIVTKVAESVIGKDGKDYPKDKWLKSHKFVEPIYDEIDKSKLHYLK